MKSDEFNVRVEKEPSTTREIAEVTFKSSPIQHDGSTNTGIQRSRLIYRRHSDIPAYLSSKPNMQKIDRRSIENRDKNKQRVDNIQ